MFSSHSLWLFVLSLRSFCLPSFFVRRRLLVFPRPFNIQFPFLPHVIVFLRVSLLLLFLDGSFSRVQFVQNHFVSEYDPTIEQTYRKQVTVDDETLVLDILDTAGQEEYSVMRDQYILSGQGFVLVYSIASKSTYLSVEALFDQVMHVKDCSTAVPVVLLGNKTDLEKDREVSTEEGITLAKKLRCPFFECSAKTRLNIEQAFTVLVRQMILRRKNSDVDEEACSPVRPTPGGAKKQPSSASFCQML